MALRPRAMSSSIICTSGRMWWNKTLLLIASHAASSVVARQVRPSLGRQIIPTAEDAPDTARQAAAVQRVKEQAHGAVGGRRGSVRL